MSLAQGLPSLVAGGWRRCHVGTGLAELASHIRRRLVNAESGLACKIEFVQSCNRCEGACAHTNTMSLWPLGVCAHTNTMSLWPL